MPNAGHLLDLFHDWTPDAGHARKHPGRQSGEALRISEHDRRLERRRLAFGAGMDNSGAGREHGACLRTFRSAGRDLAGAAQRPRSREIFRQIVESYLTTGEPLGSRNLSRLITTPLSPASVRNVMTDLEQLGLDLRAAHLGRPAADRTGAALLRRCADADRRPQRERPPRHRGAGRGRRQVGRERAERGVRPAVGPDPRRRRGARRQVQRAAQAHRIRAARAGSARWSCWSATTARSKTASSSCRSACRPRR